MNPDSIARLLDPIVASFGLELESVEIVPAGKRSLLRIVVDGDGAEGRGPGVDEIGEATKAISQELDQSDAVGKNAYTLEVSSRGISRPLTDPKHWRRNQGRLVKITFSDTAVEPEIGRIVESGPAEVSVEIDDQVRQISYADIATAVIQIEFAKKEG